MSAAKIRELNDVFRATLDPSLGRITITAGVNALPADEKALVLRRVATFSEFNEARDPYHEHDFGSFTLVGRKFFWKIDYFDAAMVFESEDPADASKTTRVLTIMLAEEY